MIIELLLIIIKNIINYNIWNIIFNNKNIKNINN